MPCTARAPIRKPAFGAKPHASDDEREDGEADDEDLAPPEEVGELAAGDQQRCEDERVGGDDPFELRDRDVQVLLDRRQRDVHDGVVQHDHEEAEGDRGERPPLLVLLGEDACSHSNSRLASTKLVDAKLAERIRVPQGVRLHLAAVRGARRARERDAAAAPARSRELRGAAPDLGRGARPLLARARRRPRDRVLAALDVGRRLLARARVVDLVQRRPRQRRARDACTAGRTRSRTTRRFVGLYEDGGRESLTFAEASRQVDPARRGARRARRRRGRPGRDLHADVPGRRRRGARVRAHRRRVRADLLRLRRARDRLAPRGLAGEGRDLRRLVAPPRQADRDARDARRSRAARARARDRVEPRDALVARRRDAAARDARAGRGRLGGAVSARLHVRHDRQAEGRAPRPGRLPRLDRARGGVPDRREAGRPRPLRDRHGLDHGAVDGRRRRRRRRDGRLRRGRARLAARPAVEARRVGAGDDARPLAHARARAIPHGEPTTNLVDAEGDLHDRRAVEPRSVPLALRARRRRARRRS